MGKQASLFVMFETILLLFSPRRILLVRIHPHTGAGILHMRIDCCCRHAGYFGEAYLFRWKNLKYNSACLKLPTIHSSYQRTYSVVNRRTSQYQAAKGRCRQYVLLRDNAKQAGLEGRDTAAATGYCSTSSSFFYCISFSLGSDTTGFI